MAKLSFAFVNTMIGYKSKVNNRDLYSQYLAAYLPTFNIIAFFYLIMER